MQKQKFINEYLVGGIRYSALGNGEAAPEAIANSA